ncbi:hypothetical protein, partial [Aliarcobacter cryaerophilus]|uniref:hypothetical protein n=1 Tax=Aliarcobacter cryaerophilus TaxID=28198 RepID=UPI003DA52965
DGSGEVDLDKNTNQTPEGGKLYYVPVAIDSNGKPLDIQKGTVDLTYGTTTDTTDKDATLTGTGVDIENNPTTATIGTVFSVDAKDDYYSEGDEKFTVTISNPNTESSYKSDVVIDSDHNKVTSTIKDNPANKDTSTPTTPTEPTSPSDTTPKYGEEDTIYVVITGNDTKYEGGTLTHTIKLVDKDGNSVIIPAGEEITVKIVYTGNATKGTDYTATETVIFTNTTGSTITISNPTIDDFIADNNESYTATIGQITQKEGTFENIEAGHSQSYKTANPTLGDGKSVTGTILDDTDNTPNDPNDNGTKEGNHEQVILKIVAVDKDGNPLFESDGKTYKTTSNVAEGDKAYYKVFVFAPNSTTFNDTTKLAIQGGTVTVSTQDIGAKGISVAQTKLDGTEDYTSKSIVDVTVGDTIFEVQTKDDYKAETEANETFKVVIDANSYKHPNNNDANALYENVTIDNSGVTTTIVDNNANKNQTIGTSVVDTNSSTYGEEDTVWAVIETINSTTSASVVEGNTVTYRVKFVDKGGNTVIVSQDTNVTIKFAGNGANAAFLEDLFKFFGSNGTTEITGFNSTSKELTIKIPANSGTTTFTIQTRDDFTAEGDEKFDLSISGIDSNEFENLVFDKTKAGTENKVTTTIKDGVTLGTPKNAYVDEDNFDVTNTNSTIRDNDNKTGHVNGNLNISKNGETDFQLSFDDNINNIKVYKGDASSSDTFTYGDSRGTTLQSGGKNIIYQLVGTDKIIGYINGNTNDKVFEITLDQNNGKYTGEYTYTQYKNIDHPVKGDATNLVNDDNITFEFGFKITDQGSTSDVVKFKVTVNDSLPKTSNWTEEVNEDGSKKIVISPESFAGGYIEISNGTMNGSEPIYYKLGKTASGDIVNKVDIYDPNDLSKVVGKLETSGDGTVLFTPNADYSNYDYTKNPSFSYKVSDFDGDTAGAKVEIKVKPVADAPTIFVKDITTYEDALNYNIKEDGNKAEGANKIPLGLKTPLLSKDSEAIKTTIPTDYTSNNKDNVNPSDKYNEISTPDQNGDKTGDNPERNGEITLTFTNGDKLTGAKIFNGSTEVATINSANQEVKVVIVKTSGGTDIDTDYHHKGTLPAKGENVLYLTKTEYENLKIQHAEDNDTDIKITIKVTSYEVDYIGKPLFGHDTYTDKTNTNLKSETTADMTVKINPVTDDIKLEFDTAAGGTISQTIRENDTFTFTDKIKEGSAAINLNSILSNTSGGIGATPDLDGSEKRTYTISDIPEGTIVKIGSTEAIAGKDGKATLTFKDAQNKLIDPPFTMKFPEHFGGGVKATITLSVYDKGVDSTDTAGAIKTQTVYLNIDVEPVATTPDLNTFQVAQAIGYEDAGRSKGNTLSPSSNIDQPAKGIPLKIKVSSDDTDGSEKANIKITNIPTGAVIYYNGVVVNQDTAGTVIINNFDNSKSLVYIPPFNDDTDATLKVFVEFVDTVKYNGYIEGNPTYGVAPYIETKSSGWSSTGKDLSVIVKNVADAPVGTSLKDTGLVNINGSSYIKATEDTLFNLKDVYKTPASLASSDSDNSEELTVRVNLKDGFTISNGSPYFIDNGEYVVKASDIIAGNIKIVPPANFSGTTIFDLTYVTTEKAGENDSKTWYTQNVGIFVEPQADNVTVASGSTIYEDNQGGAGNGGNKIDLKPTLTDTGTTNGTETVEGVKILASSVPTGYTLYSNEAMTTPLTAVEGYYVLTQTQWENGIYSKNSTPELVSGDFTLKVTYTVKDTNGVSSDTKDFTHDHKVIVKAVTDQPSLGLGTITTTDSNKTTISGTTVTVKSDENADFTIPVTTTSDDKDSSEKVQEIIISGVPKGVEVVGATYYGYSGSPHNGIWVISNPSDKNLDSNGALQSIQFVVKAGADFEDRPITITTYTKDEATDGTKVESAPQTITIKKSYTSTGPGTGTPADLELATKVFDATEDTEFSLGSMLKVNLKDGGNTGSGGAVITISDIPDGSKITGYDYSYVEGGKTFYVVVGNGNAADMNTKLSNVKITPPKDVNSEQVGSLKGDFTFKANIATHHNGTYNGGNSVDGLNTITPVTDEMTIAINVANTNEDTATPITITLSNPSDGSKTELIGNSITIKINETWKDLATGGVGTKGTLTDSSGKYNIVDNGDGTYTITPKNVADNFKVDTPISGLVYTPATNRDGDVKFEVSVQNKEGNSIILTSKGDTTIKVNPVVDMKPEVTVVTATGTEDTAVTVGSTTLANAVKLNVTPKTGETFDSSEKFTNIVLDEVPNGFTVWYKVGSDLVMATNIGKSGGADFDLTPNISTDGLTHRNKWLVPVTNGAMPDIYINAPENWAGDFDFKAQFTLKEQNLTTTEKTVVDVSGKITPVADGVTIDPINTFGKAFEWIDLKLNANMKDVDGSETMSLELSGLGANAQFKISGTDTLVSAVYSDNKWTLSGIKYDEINKIQFTNDKDVNSVGVKAWTVESGMLPTDTGAKSSEVNSTFNLDIKDVGGILELDKGINLDFSKLSTDLLKGLNTINLSITGENKLENLKLDDILKMTNDSGELTIKGLGEDKVSFKNETGNTWSKAVGTGDNAGFDIYTNSGNSDIKVKVEQAITDGITS